MSVTDDLKKVFAQGGNGIMRIVFINAIVFILVNILGELIRFTGNGPSLIYWLSLPGNLPAALRQFWGILTYMFLHEGLSHILFNMLWLYWIGKIFVEYVSSKQLVAVYILGGLSGGLLFLSAAMLFPSQFSNTYLLGASAGVMAVVIATAVLVPEYTLQLIFFGPVRLKYIALVSFILTSLIDLTQNTGGKIAHIGGALFGMYYMIQYKKGKDYSKFMVVLIDRITNLFSKTSNIRVSYRKKMSDDEYNIAQKEKQQKVDLILDKISKAGYESLTKEEKDFLFKASGKK